MDASQNEKMREVCSLGGRERRDKVPNSPLKVNGLDLFICSSADCVT